MGQDLKGRILHVNSFGIIVDTPISCCGRGGSRRPLNALVPADQLASVSEWQQLKLGSEVGTLNHGLHCPPT